MVLKSMEIVESFLGSHNSCEVNVSIIKWLPEIACYSDEMQELFMQMSTNRVQWGGK